MLIPQERPITVRASEEWKISRHRNDYHITKNIYLAAFARDDAYKGTSVLLECQKYVRYAIKNADPHKSEVLR